jgi:hypothetical protein
MRVQLLLLAFALPACNSTAPEPAVVETTFELFPAEMFGTAPWKCAVALPPIERRGSAMQSVIGAEERVIPLEYLTAAETMVAIGDGFEHFDVPTLHSAIAGVAGVRAVIDAGVPAIVPFHSAAGARAVLVAGYRTVEASDGTCTDELQDILVVDTVDVIAYGMALGDFQSRVASADVLAVLTSDEAAGPLNAEGFAPRQF